MKKLFDYANKYIKSMDWKEFAVFKFCLGSLGLLIGVLLPDSARLYAIVIAAVIFVPTYIYLMIRFFMGMKNK